MFRTVFANTSRSQAVRAFSTTRVANKSVTEKVSEVASDLNKKVGQGLASAIESGEKTTEKAKKVAGDSAEKAKNVAGDSAKSTRDTMDKTSTIASQKVNKASAEAKATKEELKDAAK
ncbi:hypothetical protein M422DRAFT_50025 [Sphaerobolus stellatus SS14]|uniref:Uncharacterized protein n=1 Tax=Sphaerobolus stellatus (strain SS14) TaxID=990650 RepID=A0A0C9VL35_SPHS4|nr:hypothetical protein M422DRAFT_50025 [Sphaerobolus stellatus SS14]